jgi:hypothetical protein
MGALVLLLFGEENGSILLASSPVRTPLPSEKWLSLALVVLLCLSLSLAIVLRWLLKCSRGYGRVSISSSAIVEADVALAA